MAIKYMDVEEWYPVFGLRDFGLEGEEPRNWTEEELVEYEAMMELFHAWQKRIRERYSK